MRLFLCLLFTLCNSFAFAQFDYDCFNQSNQKANWQFLGPVNTDDELMHQRFGNVICMSINPKDSNEIFVASPTGALMHTTNRGQSWSSLTDQTPAPIIGVNDIIVDYSKRPYEILIATASNNEWYDTPNFGILKSTDGGKTWVQKKVQGAEQRFQPAFFEFLQHKNLLFVRSNKSIYLSKNKGESWQPLLKEKTIVGGLKLKEREIRRIFYEPKQALLYFSTKQKFTSRGNENAKLYTYSLDNGSIKDLTPLLLNEQRTTTDKNGFEAIQINPNGNGTLLLSASHYNSDEFFVYTYDYLQGKVTNAKVPNRGALSGSSLHWFRGLKINPLNKSIQYLAGVYLYKSIDGGKTFKKMFPYSFGYNSVPHVDIRSMQITKFSVDGTQDHIYLGTDGGLSFSNNGGETFRNLNGRELQLTQFYGLGSSPFTGVITAGAQDNSLMTFEPETKKWSHNVRGDGYDVAYSKNIPGLVYGQYNSHSLYFSTNDIVPFKNNTRIVDGDANNRKTLITHPDGDLFFAAKKLYHLPEKNGKWIQHKTPLSHKAAAIDVCASNAKIIYMSGLWGQLIKSEDGGKSWEDISKNIIVNGKRQKKRIQSICISTYDEDKVWIGFGYIGSYDDMCKETVRVVETSDGGKTWTNSSQGLPVFAIQDLIFLEGSYESIFAATDQGIYFKRGSGYQWQRFSDKLPNTLIGELEINYCRGKLLAATYGRGLWETDLPIIKDKNPLILRGSTIFSAPKGEAKVVNQDILLRGRAKLIIDCPVYMSKGSSIRVKRKAQVEITENGKLINGCGNSWKGIVEK
jgi:photosystem II stability/assembly factor-like uncharacterized protein